MDEQTREPVKNPLDTTGKICPLMSSDLSSEAYVYCQKGQCAWAIPMNGPDGIFYACALTMLAVNFIPKQPQQRGNIHTIQ